MLKGMRKYRPHRRAAPVPTAAATPAAPAAPPQAPPPLASAAASLPGGWDFRADAGKGVIAGTLRFCSTASGLAGVYVGLHGNATEPSNLHATGAGVSFDLVTPTAVWYLEGILSSDSIDGTFQTADRSIRWKAVRKSAAPPSPTPRR